MRPAMADVIQGGKDRKAQQASILQKKTEIQDISN